MKEKEMLVFELLRKLKKGMAYFNDLASRGVNNPVVRRQAEEFEKEVIIPFDRECAKINEATREIVEELW